MKWPFGYFGGCSVKTAPQRRIGKRMFLTVVPFLAPTVPAAVDAAHFNAYISDEPVEPE